MGENRMNVTFVHRVTGQTREIAVADGTEASKVLTKAKNKLMADLAGEHGGDDGSQWRVMADHPVKPERAVAWRPRAERR
jgi:hypothetical protein